MPLLDTEHAPDSLPFEETLATLRSVLPEKLRQPHVGIVCGSGLHTLAAAIREVVEVPYSTLAGLDTVQVCCNLARSYIPRWENRFPLYA